MLKEYRGKKPILGEKVFVADNATVIGDVILNDFSSVWFGAVLRADIAGIRVGRYSNIQDLSVVHVDYDVPTVIGDYVTVGHKAVIHACEIGDCVLIGMGAVILSGARIGEGSIIGAGAVVRENDSIPPHSLAVGVPAKIVKSLSDKEIELLKEHALKYHELSATFL